MKKAAISLFLIINILLSFYADDSLPVLPKTGNNFESFIPEGWKLLLSAKGDLNNDKMEDIVAIIEQPDTEKQEDQTYNARIIFVILKSKENYYLSVQANNTVFLSGESGNCKRFFFDTLFWRSDDKMGD
jgi:hypothetical protein